MNDDLRVYAAAAGIGAVAGLRAMTAPALVSRAAAAGDLDLEESGLSQLGSDASVKILTFLAVGEMIADKTPAIPNRTDFPGLLARILSGGLCGAAICSAKKQPMVAGALLGGLAAAGATFLAFHLRQSAAEQWNLPDFPIALAEDAAAVAAGQNLLASLPSGDVENLQGFFE